MVSSYLNKFCFELKSVMFAIQYAPISWGGLVGVKRCAHYHDPLCEKLDLLHREAIDLGNLNRNASPLTSPCFGFAKTSLSFYKERDVAQRQGEVTVTRLARD